MRALTLFGVECRKAHRRHDLPVVIGIALLVLLWGGTSYKLETAQELASGFSSLYYAVPIMNAVVMPVGMATLASRIWDVETKGESCKLLFTLQSRGSLFWGKAALGLLENVAVCVIETAGIYGMGLFKGVTEPPRPGRFFWLFAATFLVNAMLYFLSLLITIRVRNPVAALAVGFCGALIGLFAAFMPVVFSYFIPFGYYVPLSAVSMHWDAETRISTFPLTEYPLWLLGVTAALALLAAAACRRAIETKEV